MLRALISTSDVFPISLPPPATWRILTPRIYIHSEYMMSNIGMFLILSIIFSRCFRESISRQRIQNPNLDGSDSLYRVKVFASKLPRGFYMAQVIRAIADDLSRGIFDGLPNHVRARSVQTLPALLWLNFD